MKVALLTLLLASISNATASQLPPLRPSALECDSPSYSFTAKLQEKTLSMRLNAPGEPSTELWHDTITQFSLVPTSGIKTIVIVNLESKGKVSASVVNPVLLNGGQYYKAATAVYVDSASGQNYSMPACSFVYEIVQ